MALTTSTTFPGSPRLIKAGLVVADAENGTIRRVIALQYNPESLTRSLEVQAIGGEGGGERTLPLRFKAPAVESFRFEAIIDAADQLEAGDPQAAAVGLGPQLSMLEALAYPTTDQLLESSRLADSGTLEIAPLEAPLLIFVWGKNRVAPVQLKELSITEELFDPSLNPLRAKVSLSLRVLSRYDLGFKHQGASIYLAYQKQKERLAALVEGGALSALGIGGLP